MVLSLQTVNHVNNLVARVQQEGQAPALVAAISRNGVVAHVAGAGDPVPDRDLQFRIGSISKTLTAAVLLGLRDEGRLTLADPIGMHLPDLPAGVSAVPLRQLLGQAGGLQREPEGEWWERSAGGDLTQLVAGVSDAKLAFAPYARFHYSNLAYGLLGGVITTLTGQPWYEAVSSRLLTPLGMLRTTYEPQEPFARGYVVHPWQGTLREEPRHDAGAMAPAGQLWSTAADLSRWAAVLASASPPAAAQPTLATAPLSPASIAEMVSPVVIADPDAWTSGYGLGLQLWRFSDRVFVGHTGSMPGYLAVLAVHRPSHTGVVAFANTYSLRGHTIGGLGAALLETVLDNEPVSPPAVPWRPSVAPPAGVEPLCGRWWWMGREFEASWDARAGHLVITPPRAGVAAWRFIEDGTDTWRGLSGEQAGELLRVLREADGTVTALDIATFIFTRDPLPLD